MNGLWARWRLRLNDPTSGLVRLGLLLAIWSALVAGALAWNTHRQNQAALSAATAAARATIGKDLSARKWATSHGGVYVPPTEHTPPNPYLNVPDRDVVTSTGQSLTLINPAYMLRQMQSDFPGDYGTKSRITSLKPINPGNAADAWESKALQAFERGSGELLETQQIDGQPYLRMMRPFIVEANCLKCHAQQGYKLGDIRGGISSAVPLAPFLALERESHTGMMLIFGAIWLIGLAGLAWMGASLRRTQRLEIIARSAAAIEESEEKFRNIVERSFDAVHLLDKEGRFTYSSPAVKLISGYRADEVVGAHFKDFVVEEDLPKVYSAFNEEISGKAVNGLVLRAKKKDGTLLFLEVNGGPIFKNREVTGVQLVYRDITERIRAEEALRASEERLRLEMNRMPIGYIVWDTDFRVVTWNPAAEKIFGFTADEARGRHPYELIVPKAAQPQVDAIWRRLCAGDETAHSVNENTTKDGHTLLCSWTNTPLKQSDGTVLGVLSMVQDITERQRAEAAFQALVGSAVSNVGAAFFHEAAGRLCAWLGAECAIVGELVDDNRVRALAMQLDGKAVAHYEYALPGTPCESATEKGYCAYSEGVQQLFPEDKDLADMGAQAYVGIPVRDTKGKVNGILCVISRHQLLVPPMAPGVFEIIGARVGTEIERKHAEAQIHQLNAELERRVAQRTAELEQKAGELQHSEAQLRVTLESLVEGLIELDPQGRVLLMNPEAERLLRWSGQETRGKPVSELVRLCDAQGQSLPAEQSCIERALQWGEVSRNEEQWLQRADGSRFLAACIASPIVGEGRVKGVVASFQDISERKLAEHLRTELIARVSHELRTPLAGIQGAAELLRSKKDLAAPKREQLLEIIATDSGRLGALVENFTELRRHLAGEVRYQFEPLALPPLLQAAIERAAQGDTQHRFQLEAPDTLPAIPADAAGINRVLDNLLSNAVKFSPQGGDITLAARVLDGALQVSVRDQGVGIAPEALPKLFTPLFQAEASDTRRFGGAGLGLAMVKAIVEAHGGRVWAESEPGQGSTFYFTLSISPPHSRRGLGSGPGFQHPQSMDPGSSPG